MLNAGRAGKDFYRGVVWFLRKYEESEWFRAQIEEYQAENK